MTLYAAVVYTIEDVHLLTAGASLEAVTERVGGYVRGKAEHVLWSEDAARVYLLLDLGRTADAVELYFARVGDRWEREHLKIECVEELPAGTGGTGSLRRARGRQHMA